MTVSISPARAEQSEAAALYDVETRAPARTRASLGIEAARIGGGAALSMRNDPTGLWSRALGFGFQEPVTAGLIAEICEFYRSRETPIATIQLASQHGAYGLHGPLPAAELDLAVGRRGGAGGRMTALRLPEGVGLTALITAYARAQESRRAEPLFTDPLAAVFVAEATGVPGVAGAALPRLGPAREDGASPLWDSLYGYFTGRTPFYDRFVSGAVATGAGRGRPAG